MTNKNAMKNKPIFPLLMFMAFPPMLSMLIQSLYNIIDSIFVSQLGEEALAAVSFIFPLQNLALAFACGIGIAMNAHIARQLGAGNNDEASHTTCQGLLISFIHAIIFIFIGLFLIDPFLSLFTQNQQVLSYGKDYGSLVLTFSFGLFLHIAIEKTFQACGNMIVPMIMQMLGAIVNIVLDPIFIFGYFGFPALGVQGAALATIIGQLTAAFLSLVLFIKYNDAITLSSRHFRIDFKVIKQLYGIAIPSGTMMCLPSVLVSILNGALVTVSQTAVAFFGIYFKLQTFIYMPANGIIQGLRPIMSYNYGAGIKKRMDQSLKIAGWSLMVILLSGTLVFSLFPEAILSLFHANAEMLSIGIPGLRILSLAFICSTFAILMSGVFEALGKGFYSLIISLLRQFLIILPLSFLLITPLGLTGIWLTFPLSEIIASFVAFVLFKKVYQNIKIFTDER